MHNQIENTQLITIITFLFFLINGIRNIHWPIGRQPSINCKYYKMYKSFYIIILIMYRFVGHEHSRILPDVNGWLGQLKNAQLIKSGVGHYIHKKWRSLTAGQPTAKTTNQLSWYVWGYGEPAGWLSTLSSANRRSKIMAICKHQHTCTFISRQLIICK